MDRIETPVILLSAVIVIVNLATLFQINIEEVTTFGYSIKPTDLRSHRDCGKLRSIVQCTSPYTQNYINALSNCGTHGSAHIDYAEEQCRRNHNGEYCGVILTSGSVSQVILHSCTDPKSCTPGCADILRSTLDFVGCCFSNSAFSAYFNACSISLPRPCPPSSLMTPKITYDSSCSSTDLFHLREYTATCDNMPPVIQALNEKEECQVLAEDYNLSCSINNNEYCMARLQAFDKKTTSPMMKAIYVAANQCSTENTCSSECKTLLSYIKDEIGCCFNTFDASTLNFRVNFTSLLKDDLWNMCGINRPKLCNSVSRIYVETVAVLMAMLIGYS